MQVCEYLAIKILKIVHIESNIFHVTLIEWNSWGSHAVNCFRKDRPWNGSEFCRAFPLWKCLSPQLKRQKFHWLKHPGNFCFLYYHYQNVLPLE